MFKNAINKNLDCIKPFATAFKTPYSDNLTKNMFPVVVLNDEGWVLTTRGAVNHIILADKVRERYENIREELIENKVPPKKIYKKYKVKDDEPVIAKNVFLNTLESWKGLKIFAHETLDLALIKFEDAKNIFCKDYPVLAKKNASQGEYLCRLGYPYPEFSAFRYDHRSKDIILNEVINNSIQLFPLDGMVTRYLADKDGNISLFELSNYTFPGEGPVINKDGELIGFQVGAAYKDTEIDISTKLKRKDKEIEINQYNFVPFSICINIETIKEFLDKYKVSYKEK